MALNATPCVNAYASPSDAGDTSGGGQCTWQPIPPTVVMLSNTKMATAGMQIGPCTVEGNPSGMTICLSIKGESSAGRCKDTMSSMPVHVYYPYVAGATYVTKGIGCVEIYVEPFKLCQTFGPTEYTL
ncbi:hypothetical protein A5706_09825 [Mycobacterium sp. E796]|nr:hypothetical protein A5706_09825 [Mycobacterium sp. E796]